MMDRLLDNFALLRALRQRLPPRRAPTAISERLSNIRAS